MMQKVSRVIVFLIAALLALTFFGCGAQQGRTDRYDGYTVRTEKAPAQPAAEEQEVPTRATDGGAAEDYVLNKSSMKFHYPDCSGAKEIKPSNRWDYHGTRQSVLDMGYVPCKICDP